MLIKLMLLSQQLLPGKSITIPRDRMVQAVQRTLTSQIFDSVRDSDMKEFVEKVSLNWEIELTENLETGHYTMHKPEHSGVTSCPK